MNRERLTGAAGASPASALYQACEAMQARYPLAVEPVTSDGSQAAMTVMVTSGASPEFFVLHHVSNGVPHPFWGVHPWGTGHDISVEPDGGVKAARGVTLAEAQHAVATGVPLPRDGSLFGWAPQGTVTALIACYVRTDEHHPVPSWTLMPLAGASPGDLPPFMGERLFGHWFWDHVTAGRAVSLDEAVGRTSRAVWWVTPSGIESGLCAVARDVAVPGGRVLPRGLFAWQGLGKGVVLPPLADALAMRGKTDLACRFRSEEAA